MSNLSYIKRQRMLEFLNKIREEHSDDESIIAINEIENELVSKKYGLVWEEHEERVDIEMKMNIPVFTEVVDKEIISDNKLPYNFILEGDNLHSLKLLEKTHKNRIDLIYIDPPYNTESMDFQYNDNYIDSLDNFKHSKWISFMNERLIIARKLLANDGCILISINENELFVLKLLCDEIFGEENYLTTFTVRVRHEDRILKGDKDFHEVTEFLLMYRKSIEFKPKKRIEDNTSIAEYVYKIEEKNINPEYTVIDGKQVAIFKPEEYEIIKISPNIEGLKVINIRGSIKEGNSSGRFFMKNLADKLNTHKGYLYKVFDMGADDIPYRYFRIPKGNRVNGDYYQGVPKNRADIKELPYANLLDFEVDFNNVGYEGGIEFRNGKKPLSFVNFCFDIANIMEKNNAIILDFFAGSGTTAQALLEYNKKIGGNRTVILCSNNEVGLKNEEMFMKINKLNKKQFLEMKCSNDKEWLTYCKAKGICSSITYPRITKAIEGYTTKRVVNKGTPANFKYYQTDFISKKLVDEDYNISEELLKHIVEMVQLEHAIKLDGKKYILIMSDEEADKVFSEKKLLNECEALYISVEVLLTKEQEKQILEKGIKVYTIPDYYFESELLEVGER